MKDQRIWVLNTECEICNRFIVSETFPPSETEEEKNERLRLTTFPCVLIYTDEANAS